MMIIIVRGNGQQTKERGKRGQKLITVITGAGDRGGNK